MRFVISGTIFVPFLVILTNSHKRTKFKSQHEIIKSKSGESFTSNKTFLVLGGYGSVGRSLARLLLQETDVNLELVPDQKIVQSWRYSDWPEGHYSKATFSLKEVPGVTCLTFTQTGVPEEFYDDISQGWRDYYWEPMKEMLEKQE